MRKKMKTRFHNYVFHTKSNTFAQYSIIWTNYVIIVALILVNWPKY
jgi:hypothetical protein